MIWVRWTLPRLRIDQVMTTCLKYCVPIAAVMFLGATVWTYLLPGGLFLPLYALRQQCREGQMQLEQPAESSAAAARSRDPRGGCARNSQAARQSSTRRRVTVDPINWHTFFFLLFALVACGFAVAVVVSSNIVRMAFYLVVSLAATAGLFFLAGADFVGAMQLMIYVGGTLVLLIFGVMLTARGRSSR